MHLLYAIVIIAKTAIESYSVAVNISNDVTKKFEELKKQISLKIQKLRKETEYLQKEINALHQKININFEYCKL